MSKYFIGELTIFAKRIEYGGQTNRISRLQTTFHTVCKGGGTGGGYCRADGAVRHTHGADINGCWK